MSKKPKQERMRFCVFCNAPNVSREHIWADWLSPYIEKTSSTTSHFTNFSTFDFVSGTSKSEAGLGKLNRQGHPISQRLRIVCEDCNNGWMSRLQNTAKNILVPLIEGKWKVLSNDEINILSAWATMTAMVIEQADPPTISSNDSERGYLKEHILPPNNWNIWIGHYTGSEGEFGHTGICLLQPPITALHSRNCNTGINTFTIGQLLIHTFSTTSNNFIMFPYNYSQLLGIAPLWPIQNLRPNTPPKVLGISDAQTIQFYFRNQLLLRLSYLDDKLKPL